MFYTIRRYRAAVLRTLPQLQKLDNVAVTPEEIKEAQRRGAFLSHPDDVQETDEEEYVPQQQYRYPPEPEYSPQISPNRQEVCRKHLNVIPVLIICLHHSFLAIALTVLTTKNVKPARLRN